MKAGESRSDSDSDADESLLGRVAEEYFLAVERGERPSLSNYAERYPKIAAEIRELFPALTLVGSSLNAASEGSPQGQRTVRKLGDYQLIREIGRGGMGIVYEAEQLSLGRRVALKVLPYAAMLDKQQLARFKNEARAAATLVHPNIVSIYSIGSERGVHFYAMQLIEGQSIADIIDAMRAISGARNPVGAATMAVTDEESLTADTEPAAARSTLPDFDSHEYCRVVACLGIQAAEAIDHAHRNGILHRDVKPANLMVDEAGKLWITDFGLARIEADAGMTMTGDLLGTIRYMSPEQSLAKRAVVDHRSDIYSLGVTLYELLALRPAVIGDDRHELLHQIAFDEPIALRRINNRIPLQLDTIIHKAIRKSAEQRYETAQEFAEDLRRFVDNEKIKAKPPVWRDRMQNWSRRHPAALWSFTSMLLVATILSIASAVLISQAYQREAAQRRSAEAERERTTKALLIAQDAIANSSVKLAEKMVDWPRGASVTGEFLNAGLAFYDSLLDAFDANPAIMMNRARHLLILSSYLERSRFGESCDLTRQAIAVFQGLVDRFPENENYEVELAAARKRLARLIGPGESLAARLRRAQANVDRFQRGVERDPDDLDAKDYLAGGLGALREIQQLSGDLQSALNTTKMSEDVSQELVLKGALSEKRNWYIHYRATNLARRGYLLKRTNRLEEARAALTSAVAMERSVLAEVPTSVNYARWLAISLQELGAVANELGESAAAMQLIEEAEAVLRPMKPTIESFSSASMLLSLGLRYKSHILLDLNRPEEAVDAARESIVLLCNHSHPEARGELPELFKSYIDVLWALGRFNEAHEALVELLTITSQSDNIEHLNATAWMLATYGRLRDGRSAIELALKSCELTNYENAAALDILAAAYAETGDFKSAVRFGEQALKVAESEHRKETIGEHLSRFRDGRPWREK